MKYFLMLIILGLCCGGYYEFTVLQQQHAGDEQKLADLQAKLDPLTADNQKLTDDNAKLTKSAAAAQTEIADLTQQVQTAQAELTAAKEAATAQASAAKAAAVPGPAPSPDSSNALGNITTLDGKSYLNCQLLKVQASCIVVNDSAGITQINYAVMPPDLQKRFGYDAQLAPTLSDAQVATLEARRQASAGVGN